MRICHVCKRQFQSNEPNIIVIICNDCLNKEVVKIVMSSWRVPYVR